MIEALVTKKYKVVVMDNPPTIALPGLFDGQTQKNVDLGKLGRLSRCLSGYSLLHLRETCCSRGHAIEDWLKTGLKQCRPSSIPTLVLPSTKETMTCPGNFGYRSRSPGNGSTEGHAPEVEICQNNRIVGYSDEGMSVGCVLLRARTQLLRSPRSSLASRSCLT